MAGRKIDPDTENKVRVRKDKGYRYAVTVSYDYDEQAQKRVQRYVTWGTVSEDFVFTPGKRYIGAEESERDKLIFPENWDLSAANDGNDVSLQNNPDESGIDNNTDENNNRFPEPEENGPPDPTSSADRKCLPLDDQYNNRLYGSVWVLEEFATRYGLADDLLTVFNSNLSIMCDIITLALYPFVSRRRYSRVAHWQELYKTPASGQMTAPYITYLIQSITENHRLKLIAERIKRFPEKAMAGMDSATGSAWGRCLVDIRWGLNKDNSKRMDTVEAFVYSFTTHEPFYYRTFPGNTMDMSVVRTVLSDLKKAGIEEKQLALITDRAFPSQDNLARFVGAGIPFVMSCKECWFPVSDVILESVKYDSNGLPLDFIYDKAQKIYCAQFSVPTYTYHLSDSLLDSEEIEMKGLVVNLFLDLNKRMEKLEDIRTQIKDEKNAIDERLKTGIIPSELKSLNSCLKYHRIEISGQEEGTEKSHDPAQVRYNVIRKEQKIEKDKSLCGFFSSIMYKMEQNALEALEIYKIRDEEEKWHELLKDQLEFNTQDCSAEDGRAGRAFIAFCGMILASRLRYAWKHSNLVFKYESTIEVMDAMETIRYCEYVLPENGSHITSITKEQFDICQVLGFFPPRECIPVSLRGIYDREVKNNNRLINKEWLF